jgi:DNA-binding NarL/FixJ family response regulator
VKTCLVADDHPAVLQAVAQLLTAEGFVVTTAHRGDEALAKLAETRPDVAVIDAQMPGLTGIELARHARHDDVPTGIVLYSGAADPALLRDALNAGVQGFVLKDAPLRELIEAVNAVAAGGIYIDGAIAGSLSKAAAGRPLPRLTKREREVLAELAQGRSYEEIAARLSISAATVRRHVQLAMRRLNATTDTQAVATAVSLHLIG